MFKNINLFRPDSSQSHSNFAQNPLCFWFTHFLMLSLYNPNAVFNSGRVIKHSFKSAFPLFLLLLCNHLSAQNAIVGTGFSSGWGGASCPTGSSNFKSSTTENINLSNCIFTLPNFITQQYG